MQGLDLALLLIHGVKFGQLLNLSAPQWPHLNRKIKKMVRVVEYLSDRLLQGLTGELMPNTK